MRAALSLLVFCLPASAGDFFVEAAKETGLAFRHSTGSTGQHFMPEIMGSGVALLDYDGDGDLDVFLVQGAVLESDKKPEQRGDRLFRNLLAEQGRPRFEDVTAEAGFAAAEGFGMGAAAGDIDNDGDIDLFVSRYGPDQLYLNQGDGTFAPAPPSDLGDPSFGASAAFLDYDRDGLLDLFLARYNGFTVEGNKDCRGHTGARDYCGPLEYFPLPDRLYRNVGEGRFRNVTAEAGVDQAFGNGLGVVAGYFDSDDWIDLYVANDKTPNQLWLNQQDGTFEDAALLRGVAYNADGMAEAGMGVSAGDYDSDGDPDLFLTHIGGETNTLYRNDGDGLFDDVTAASGLAHTSVSATGFGVHWLDFDNDGDLDLFAVNGEVRRSGRSDGPFPYDQPNQLFRNDDGRFEDVSDQAGEALQHSGVSRGAAFGDIDNDGDIDIVVNDANGPARLLLNQAGGGRHWLLVRLVAAGRDAHGARIVLIRKEKEPMWRTVGTDGSYLSSSDPRVHFGLGEESVIDRLQVTWPNGAEQSIPVGEADRILTLTQGR